MSPHLSVRLFVSRASFLGLSVAFLSLFSGCATQDLKPQTGDVSFRLHWSGEADLDLHVVDPTGDHTGVVVPGYERTQLELEALARRYKAEQEGRELPPGGDLDVDCNASPDRMCERPIENIFWAPGTAKSGRYQFWAVLFQRLEDDTEEVPFTLEVRRGERVVESYRGVLSNAEDKTSIYAYSY